MVKAVKALTKYFMLIETNDLAEARAFLEGKKAYKNSPFTKLFIVSINKNISTSPPREN